MELKITADKKLLEALEKIAAAINAAGLYGVNAGVRAQIDAAREAEEKATIEAKIGAVAEPAQDAAPAPETAPKAKPEELTTHATEPATEAPEAPTGEPAPSRDEVQRLAIVKIQGGQRKGVQDLVAKYGVARVGEVPEDKLAAFKAELEALA